MLFVRTTGVVSALDKYHQRCYLTQVCPNFVALEEMGDGDGEMGDGKIRPQSVGFPVVLKARRHGYDGQGTFVVKDIDALKHRLEAL